MAPSTWYRDFLEDLRQLLKAGIPVLEALDSLAREKRGARADLARRLLDRVRGGSSLADAMAGSSQIPEEHAAMIEAGERSGTLERVLARIVERLDRRRELLERVLPKIGYPAGLLVMAVALLPLYLIFLGKGWMYVAIQVGFFGPLLALAFLVWRGASIFGLDSPSRAALERFVVRIPGLGAIALDLAAGKAFGILGLLLEAGVSLGESLPLVARVSRWKTLSRGFSALEPRIRAGKSLAEALEADPVFRTRPAWITRAVVGEKAGTLDRSFRELGEGLEDGAWRRVGSGLRLLPFLLIPLVGAFVLWQALKVVSGVYGGL